MVVASNVLTLPAVAAVCLLTAQVAAPRLQAETAASPEEPLIAWSTSTLSEVMFPGTRANSTVRFRSKQNLSSVSVEVTPSLVGIISVKPTYIASIVADKDYEVDVTLAAPSIFQKRSFGGTIQIRHIGQPPRTYAPPLTVNLQIDWMTQTTGLGLTVSFPAQWKLASARPVTDPSGLRGVYLEDSNDEFPGQGIGITIDRNSSVAAVTASLRINTLLQVFSQTVGDRQWTILRYVEDDSQDLISMALTQQGPDVIRVGCISSERNASVMMGLLALIR